MGEIFSFQIKRMASDYWAQSSHLQERVPGERRAAWLPGNICAQKRMGNELGTREAAAKHTVNRHQGKAHPGRGGRVGRELMSSGGPVQGEDLGSWKKKQP